MAKVIETRDSFFDIWRKIPPEEKLLLMARAQSKGVGSTLLLLTVSGAMAAGLRIPWLFWSAFVGIPFVFQFSSAKAWRDLKPRTILEYLAARSAARRYAYGAHSKDLTVSLLFKGTLQPDFTRDEEELALEAKIEHKDRIPVWIALFPDVVIMMSEKVGGAKLEFAQLIGDKLEVIAEGFDDDSSARQVRLIVGTRKGDKHSWVVTSHYPAALLVFERKIRGFAVELAAQIEKDRLAFQDMVSQHIDADESSF